MKAYTLVLQSIFILHIAQFCYGTKQNESNYKKRENEINFPVFKLNFKIKKKS